MQPDSRDITNRVYVNGLSISFGCIIIKLSGIAFVFVELGGTSSKSEPMSFTSCNKR